jgi:hypothetical protein
MKAFTAISAILFATVSVSTQATPQAVRPTAHAARSRVSLELGSVTVWLGMPKTEALLQLQNAGYQVLGQPSEVSKVPKNGNQFYDFSFKNGMLAYADRNWYSSQTDEMDAVLGAMAALVSEGAEACSISHDPVSKPEESADRIFINCGERPVLLMKSKVNLTEKGATFVNVDERIGEAQ